MSVENQKQALIKLYKALEEEHEDLDKLLNDQVRILDFDEVTLQRLKKQKLLLKDKIALLKAQIYPDIIA